MTRRKLLPGTSGSFEEAVHKKARHRLTDDGQGFSRRRSAPGKLETQAQAQRGGADAVAPGASKFKPMLVVLGDG